MSFLRLKQLVTIKAVVNIINKLLRFTFDVANEQLKQIIIFGFYRAGRPHPVLKRNSSIQCCPEMMGLPLKPAA